MVEGQGVEVDDQPQASGNSAELNPEKSTGSSPGEPDRAVSEGLSEGTSVPEPRSRTKKLPAGSDSNVVFNLLLSRPDMNISSQELYVIIVDQHADTLMLALALALALALSDCQQLNIRRPYCDAQDKPARRDKTCATHM